MISPLTESEILALTPSPTMASNFQFFPGTDTLTLESEAPIKADKEGRYPVPTPGSWVEI